jgi:hypothetical protein
MEILEVARWRQALGLQRPRKLNVVERIVSERKVGVNQLQTEIESCPDATRSEDDGTRSNDLDAIEWQRMSKERRDASERKEQGPNIERTKVKTKKRGANDAPTSNRGTPPTVTIQARYKKGT